MFISKTALPNPSTYDIHLFIVQQWLQRLKFDGNRSEQLIPYSHCQVVQLFPLKSLLVKAFTYVMSYLIKIVLRNSTVLQTTKINW